MGIPVIIADRNPLVRNSLQRMLSREPDMDPWAVPVDQEKIERALFDRGVGVVILNSEERAAADPESFQRMLRRIPGVKVIVMSLHNEHHYMDELFRNGASGYVLTGNAYEELPGAVRCVSRGNQYIGAEVYGGPECRPIGFAGIHA